MRRGPRELSRLERLNKVLIFRSFVADDAGLLSALFEVGDEGVGQAAIGPGDHFQTVDGVVVEPQTSRRDLFTTFEGPSSFPILRKSHSLGNWIKIVSSVRSCAS